MLNIDNPHHPDAISLRSHAIICHPPVQAPRKISELFCELFLVLNTQFADQSDHYFLFFQSISIINRVRPQQLAQR